jgi:hypothetical protein
VLRALADLTSGAALCGMSAPSDLLFLLVRLSRLLLLLLFCCNLWRTFAIVALRVMRKYAFTAVCGWVVVWVLVWVCAGVCVGVGVGVGVCVGVGVGVGLTGAMAASAGGVGDRLASAGDRLESSDWGDGAVGESGGVPVAFAPAPAPPVWYDS